MKNRFLNFFVLIIGGVIIFNLSTNILRLGQKREGLAEEQQRLEELKAQGSRLKAELEYVQSEEFIEKEAREKLNWAKEGEEVWVLPETIREIGETRLDSRLDSVDPRWTARQVGEIGEEEPNWRKWVELFGF